MCDGGKVPIAFSADICIADFILTVTRTETEFRGNRQYLIKGFFGAGAERRINLRGFLNTVDGYKTPDVLKEFLAVTGYEFVNCGKNFLFHGLLLF